MQFNSYEGDYNMSNTSYDISIDSKAGKLIFIVISIIATPIHELGHLLGYRLSGVPAKYSFICTEPGNGSESLLGVLGGPLIGLLLALVGCVCVYIFREKKQRFICIYFAITMCFTRLVPYLLCILINPNGMFPINDEGLIAQSLNAPIWQVYSFFTIVFISILLFLKVISGDYFYKCFKYGFLFYFVIMVLFEIKIY